MKLALVLVIIAGLGCKEKTVYRSIDKEVEVIVEVPVEIEKLVTQIEYRDRIEYIDREVIVEHIVEVPVEVIRYVDRPVEVEIEVEKIVEIEKIVEVGIKPQFEIADLYESTYNNRCFYNFRVMGKADITATIIKLNALKTRPEHQILVSSAKFKSSPAPSLNAMYLQNPLGFGTLDMAVSVTNCNDVNEFDFEIIIR